MKVEVDIFKGRDGEPGSDGENGATGPPGSGGSSVLASQFDPDSDTMGFELNASTTSTTLTFDTPSINTLQIQFDPNREDLIVIPSNGIYEITCNSRVIASASSGNNGRVGLTIQALICTDYDADADNTFVEVTQGVASNYSTRHSDTGQSDINKGGVSLTRLFDLEEGDVMRFELSAKLIGVVSAEIIDGTFLIVKKIS